MSFAEEAAEKTYQSSLFIPGRNCLQTATAEKAALLIDCANYYRALYHALCKAQHSIFILGWDIDGRIALLRGEEAKGKDTPVRFFDLICRKARENPDLKIFLNKWNYSIFFSQKREPFGDFKWNLRSPANVHFCSDYQIPFAGCHHQKIIVIDDEIAFCGGMDIALSRWDKRAHNVKVRERVDPGIAPFFFSKKRYGPYHDIQAMMSGPVVGIMARIVRDRWEKGAGYESIPLRKNATGDTGLWPDFKKPDFEHVRIGIARTMPRTGKSPAVTEILQAYLDQIGKAENFIYIENQYLTSDVIARALNKRLKERPGLRVLAVSSGRPRGIMEHRAMWTGRAEFFKMAGEGIDEGRFAIAYAISREQGREEAIHIHSKLMIVDDHYLHVGSANLNNRSMGYDTECDIMIEGADNKSRARIAAIRTNLIREHTGREEQDIQKMIEGNASVDALIDYQPHSRQHLIRIDNAPYERIALARQARKFGDPRRARILWNFPIRQMLGLLLVIAAFIFLFWPMMEPALSSFLSRDAIISSIEQARDSKASILWVGGIYILAGLFLFPVTVLNLTTAIVFGPLFGFIYSLAGSVASASTTFFIGHFIGEKTFAVFRNVLEKVKTYAGQGGIMGMTLIRMMPIAPFTLVNLTFGILKVPFISYTLATIFGLLPGLTAKAMFGGALGELWQNPDPEVLFFLIGSLLLWLLVIWGTHRVVQHYQKKMEP